MIGLGVGAYRLVGLDTDQLSLQAAFPEGLAAPMAGSPMTRQLVPGGFMLRSGRPVCGPVSLLAQESGRPQLRPESALLFSGWLDISGSSSSGSDPRNRRTLKRKRLNPMTKALKIRVQSGRLFAWTSIKPIPTAIGLRQQRISDQLSSSVS